METTSTHRGWIRSGDDYLCPEDGDVGYTANLADAGTSASGSAIVPLTRRVRGGTDVRWPETAPSSQGLSAPCTVAAEIDALNGWGFVPSSPNSAASQVRMRHWRVFPFQPCTLAS